MFSDHREVHTELFNPFLGLRTSTQVPLIRTLTNRVEDTDFHVFCCFQDRLPTIPVFRVCTIKSLRYFNWNHLTLPLPGSVPLRKGGAYRLGFYHLQGWTET